MSRSTPLSSTSDAPRKVEVAVIGGGPAGLSAALVLGRARRSVAVIDAGRPGHFAADAVHGFLGMENVPPRELRARVWEQLAPFDVALVEGEVVGARPSAGAGLAGRKGAVALDTGFVLTLADGTVVEAAIVLLAGGLHYGVLDVPGLAELWGDRLFHCPFCHGWEVVGQRVGLLGPPAALAHMQPLFRLWVDDLHVFPVAPVDGEDGAQAAAGEPGLATVEGAAERTVVSVGREGDEVVVVLSDGSQTRVDALFAPPVLGPVDALLEQLGLEHDHVSPMSPTPLGLTVDESGATAVRGVYAAGDVAGEQPAVVNAAQSGAKAAFGIVRLLVGFG